MAKVYVGCMYGLGGRIWSWAVEDVIAAKIRSWGSNFIVPKTRGYSQWREIAAEMKALPSDVKRVVIGHSMGGASATYVTDLTKIDLGVSYDCAGQFPSPLGHNTSKFYAYRSTAFALVPRFEIRAVPGYESRLTKELTRYSHTGCVQDPILNNLTWKLVQDLAK